MTDQPPHAPEGSIRIETLKGYLTLDELLEDESDIVPRLEAYDHVFHLRDSVLGPRREQIIDLIAWHLNLPRASFALSETNKWIFGGFNICLPVDISETCSGRLPKRALIRFAMPHAVGERYAPGAVDEKVRCEAATYVWLERHCPAIPIPRLLGIGFPGYKSFSRVESASWLNWIVWQFRRTFMWFRGEELPRFFAHDRSSFGEPGYLLMEYVEDGAMLSTTWKENRHDPVKRKNLYRSIASILLDLAKTPLPRIGSFTMHDTGLISLSNRPYTDLTAFWQKNRVPLGIPRNLTYTSVQQYVQDLVTYQDARMRHQKNSILDQEDGVFQLSALVGLRAILPQMFNTHLNHSKFVMSFSDMHQSNIFVDDEWNVTRLIDLEFACSRPLELITLPFWLSNRGVDQLNQEHKTDYEELFNELLGTIVDEEKGNSHGDAFSTTLRGNWTSGRLWFSAATESINAYPALFRDHLRPRYIAKWNFDTDAWPLAQLWSEDVSGFLESKAKDFEEYNDNVRQIFNKMAEAQGLLESKPDTSPSSEPTDTATKI